MPKILAFAGSTRKESFNKKFVWIAAEAARKAGAEVTLVDLRDFAMPLYDGDLELSAYPENAAKLKDLMKKNDGFLLSCPEYNSSITAVLKNTIDWTSRDGKGAGNLECFNGKVISLLSASPGALGGLRGLVTVRSIFGNIGSLVLPDQIALSKADEAFNPDGTLKDAKMQQRVEKQMAGFVEILKKLKS